MKGQSDLSFASVDSESWCYINCLNRDLRKRLGKWRKTCTEQTDRMENWQSCDYCTLVNKPADIMRGCSYAALLLHSEQL